MSPCLEQLPPYSPSLQSANGVLTTHLLNSFMEDGEVIIHMQRMIGLKCGQCRHAICPDHHRGVCQVLGCGCIRKRIQKRVFQVSELYQMEGGYN